MAPYEPPVAHYTQLSVPDIDEDSMFEFIGKGGHRFYNLTRDLGVRYLWYDKERKAVEIWGPYQAMLNDPPTKLRQKLDEWLAKC